MILTITTYAVLFIALVIVIKTADFLKTTKEQSHKLRVLESKILTECQIIEQLQELHKAERGYCASLEFQLNVWKERNRLVEKMMNPPANFRKKKIRGKRRKGGRR